MGNNNPLRHNLYYRIGSYGQMFTRLKEVDSIRNVDVLFLGSSHSYRGFDTRLFQKAGFKTFNLGSSYQTPLQTKYLLDNYLDSLSPKLVVLETYPAAFCDDGTESSLDIISNSKIDIQSLALALKQNRLIVYNTLIYSLYRDMVFDEKEVFLENIKRNNDTYISGGYVENELAFFGYKNYNKKKWEFNNKQFKSFRDIIEILNRREINYILIQAPITSALYSSYLNNNEFDNKISKLGKYFNFNVLIQLDDSLHFYDDDHLNKNGVKKFNTDVIKLVEKEL